MSPRSKRPEKSLLIEGDFQPAKNPKALRVVVKLTGLLMGVLLLAALIIYGVNVQFASQINALGKQTRDVNESNKELQVRLNRIQAFKNIEVSAAKISHLHPPAEMIEVAWPTYIKPAQSLLICPKPKESSPVSSDIRDSDGIKPYGRGEVETSPGKRGRKRQAQKPQRPFSAISPRQDKPENPPGGIRGNRYLIVFGLIVVILGLIVGKLLYIQVIDADHLKKKARQSRSKALRLYDRGRILDRNGVVLAQDTLVYDVFAHKDYYWKLTPQQIATALSPILNEPVVALTARLSEPYTTIGVAKNLPKQVVEQIRKARIAVWATDPKTKAVLRDKTGQPVLKKVPITGLDFSKKPVRNYPQGSLAAHMLGYVNDEADISSGIEYAARNILKKEPPDLGKALLSGRGDVIEPEAMKPENLVNIPKAEDVTLTIDSRLQYIAERELAAGLERTHAQRGTVIMMVPKTGEILAFASIPNYSPDEFYKASADQLKNWAITDVYPPGSTFKILTVACGLESKAINRNTRLLDTGRMKIGGWMIQNYDYAKHGAPGMIDLIYLLQHSSNIGSAKISLMIPRQVHHDLIQGFGMGSKTNIDLPGESSGILHPADLWDESTHASIGYGYGLAATPIQMATAVSAIANGGTWVAPHVVKKDPKLVAQRRVLSPETSSLMTELLTTSIKDAKTSTVRLEGIDVAGKTGTSRKPNAKGTGYSNNVFTSFVGYFPAQNPRALIMVVIDSPGIGEAWGSTVAGPIFHAIAQESIGYLGLKPAKISNIKPAAHP